MDFGFMAGGLPHRDSLHRPGVLMIWQCSFDQAAIRVFSNLFGEEVVVIIPGGNTV